MKKVTKAIIGLALITGFAGAAQAGGYDRHGNYYDNVNYNVFDMNQVDRAKAHPRIEMNRELSQIKNERLDRGMERRLRHERQLGGYEIVLTLQNLTDYKNCKINAYRGGRVYITDPCRYIL